MQATKGTLPLWVILQLIMNMLHLDDRDGLLLVWEFEIDPYGDDAAEAHNGHGE